jgi:ElaB/YqjD/DUF883 family membrane-anchored ribosome-binding protein
MEKKTTTHDAGMVREADELADQLTVIRRDLENLAKAVSRTAKDRAVGTANQVEETIRENPLAALAIAVGLGFLVGVLTRR